MSDTVVGKIVFASATEPVRMTNGLGHTVRMYTEQDYETLRAKYESAVRTLQDIAAMGKKAGSESAAHRLAQLGEPREAE